MNPQLLRAVAVEIEPLDRKLLTAAQLGLGERQVAPDRGPQERQATPPPNPRPKRAHALRPPANSAHAGRANPRAPQRPHRAHRLSSPPHLVTTSNGSVP